jgi:hypothetical protein
MILQVPMLYISSPHKQLALQFFLLRVQNEQFIFLVPVSDLARALYASVSHFLASTF